MIETIEKALKESLKNGKSPLIMGVCNITPDSFSDGGKFFKPEAALKQIEHLFKEGSHIVDIGAESTGPGSKPVPEDEEARRLGKIVKLAACFGVISVDTYKSSIAEASLKEGAKIINDVSALRADKKMAEVIAGFDAYAVLMFNSSLRKENKFLPHAINSEKEYQDVIKEIIIFLEERLEHAIKSGISSKKIILDPAMGAFISPNAKYSFEVLKRFEEITSYFKEFPVMVATSRKGFLGGEVEQRDGISQLTAFHAVNKRASVVRTHCPGMASEFFRVGEKIL